MRRARVVMGLVAFAVTIGCGGSSKTALPEGIRDLPAIDFSSLDPSARRPFDEVIAEVDEQKKAQPPDTEKLAAAYIRAGQLCLVYGQFEAGEVSFNNALACDKKLFLGHYGLAHLYRQKGDKSAAAEQFEKSLAVLRSNLVVAAEYLIPNLVWLGEMRLEDGQLDKAKTSYDEALRREPLSMIAKFGLGKVALAKGQPRSALSYFREVISQKPGSSNVYEQIAVAMAQQGQKKEAERQRKLASGGKPLLVDDAFMTSLNQLGNTASAYKQRGAQALAEKNYEEAIRQLRKAMELAPNDPVAMRDLGAAYNGYGQKSDAIKYLQAAIKADPKESRAHTLLASIYQERKEDEKALNEYKLAYDAAPKNYYAANDYGVALLRMGQPEKAIGIFRDVAIRFNNDETILRNLAVAYTRSGQFKEAAEHLQEARKAAPSSVELTFMLIQVLAAAPDQSVRDPLEAESLLEAVASREDTVQHAESHALVAAAKGDFPEAVKWIDQAIALVEDKESADLVRLKKLADDFKQKKPAQIW